MLPLYLSSNKHLKIKKENWNRHLTGISWTIDLSRYQWCVKNFSIHFLPKKLSFRKVRKNGVYFSIYFSKIYFSSWVYKIDGEYVHFEITVLSVITQIILSVGKLLNIHLALSRSRSSYIFCYTQIFFISFNLLVKSFAICFTTHS